MKNKLRILFVSSEINPFAKTGGLADVSSALPKTIHEMDHEVRLIMPKYGCINERRFTLRDVIRLKNVPVMMGENTIQTSVKSAFLPDTKVQVYFIEYKPYFNRQELYVDPKTKYDYPDNAQRFSLFCRGVLETLKILHWQPDIIHCNDWQTSLIPVLLQTEYKQDSFFQKASTLLTIHNLAYQGIFKKEVYPELYLPESLFLLDGPLEFYGKINFLKGGISYADAITTVSEKYSQEIQTDSEYGCGLEGVLKGRKDEIVGILNGIDYNIWNPETDRLINENYGPNSLESKIENKKALLEKNNLIFNESIPVIGMISRLADQKGFDLVAEAIDVLLGLDIQIIILGTGDVRYRTLLEKIHKKFPRKLSINLRFDDEMAHLIEAGSDIFLMPSKYEPCGLNQLYSLKYGTVPVVRNTGGLSDTVQEYNSKEDTGDGFVFNEYSASEMISAIKRAIRLYSDHKAWQRLMKRGMKLDFSWNVSAEKYVRLYTKLEMNRRKK